MFSDFLEMAGYLLSEAYKDAAAVIIGSILEAQLRKLADKHGIVVLKPDGKPKTADTLNGDLLRRACTRNSTRKMSLRGRTYAIRRLMDITLSTRKSKWHSCFKVFVISQCAIQRSSGLNVKL